MLRRTLPALLLGLGLALVPAAAAHVVAVPPLLELGVDTTVVLHVPNERREAPMTGLTVTAPAGVELRAAEARDGWRGSVTGGVAGWSGATLAAGTVGQFPLRAGASGEPRAVELTAVQRFADGGEATWQVALTVVPAPEQAPRQHLWRAVAVLLAGGGVIGASLLVLRRTRSR